MGMWRGGAVGCWVRPPVGSTGDADALGAFRMVEPLSHARVVLSSPFRNSDPIRKTNMYVPSPA